MGNITIKQIGLPGGSPIIEQPGRLAHEIAKNKADVIAILFAAITKGQEVMGISNIDPAKNKTTAEEAIKKILEVYPGAMVKDIVKALEMASFKEIELPDQLSTVSASNIFGWYRFFRQNHSDKMQIPMLPPKQYTFEPEPEEKAKLEFDFFKRCLTSPDEIIGGFEKTFALLVEMGYFPDVKSKMVFQLKLMLKKLCQSQTNSYEEQKNKAKYIAMRSAFESGQPIEEVRKMEKFEVVSDLVKKEMVKQMILSNPFESILEAYKAKKND